MSDNFTLSKSLSLHKQVQAEPAKQERTNSSRTHIRNVVLFQTRWEGGYTARSQIWTKNKKTTFVVQSYDCHLGVKVWYIWSQTANTG